VSTETDR
jgi:signal recognition particle receptor subunit alpha